MMEQELIGQDINILIVEDDDTNYFLIEELLNPYRFNLFRAIDGNQALIQLNSELKIHLVLMDIRLPKGQNGIDICRIMKKKYPFLPIIIQTAIVMNNERVSSVHGIYDGFITKPYDIKVFYKIIFNQLEHFLVNH